MSFKRDGDDSKLYQNLQKRRVSELFSEGIPEDEALLMKNGRFACLVCPHRPIFDTVSVMAVHRNGRKHMANAEKFLSEKADLEALKLKRRHQEYVRFGKVMSQKLDLPNETKSHSLLHSLGAAYDPRVKKQKLKKGERKPRLNMSGEELEGSLDFNTETTSLPTLPSNPKDMTSFTHKSEFHPNSAKPTLYNTSELVVVNAKSGTSIQEIEISADNNFTAKSYNDPSGGEHESSMSYKSTLLSCHSNKEGPSAQQNSTIPQTIRDYKRSMQSEEKLALLRMKPYISKRKSKTLSEERDNFDSYNTAQICKQRSETSVSPALSTQNLCTGSTLCTGNFTKNSLEMVVKPSHQHLNTSNECGKTLSLDRKVSLSSSSDIKKQKIRMVGGKESEKKPVLSEEKRQAGEKYLQAIGAGWKKDRGGKWIKDEDVEFDSDEEPPDIP